LSAKQKGNLVPIFTNTCFQKLQPQACLKSRTFFLLSGGLGKTLKKFTGKAFMPFHFHHWKTFAKK